MHLRHQTLTTQDITTHRIKQPRRWKSLTYHDQRCCERCKRGKQCAAAAYAEALA